MSEKQAKYSDDDLPTIQKLLDALCTKKEVEDMLRDVNATFSAPKKRDVIYTRVPQALEEKRIDLAGVVKLLRDAEEHGRQHVFLYQCTKEKAAELLDEERVRKALKEIGAMSALDKPRVLDIPKVATITEVRLERFPKGQPKVLVVKQVDRREVLLPPERTGDVITRKVDHTRAVNLARLHHDGLLEVRIQSDKKIDYADALDMLLKLLEPLLPKADFAMVSLEKAKTLMWNEEKTRRHEYRLSWGKARNPAGDSIVFAPGAPSAHLADREGMEATLAEFLKSGSAACNAWVVTFNTKDEKPSDEEFPDPYDEPEELRVVMLGEEHEFYLTAQCSGPQYEHVLGKLREYNG